jgi:formamidopyrimidine-DNA glycosylase
MPELPEVETVRRTLEKLIVGQKIMDVRMRYPKIVQTDVETFQKTLKGQVIHTIERQGKHLILLLDHDALIIHLRMEGRFFYHPSHHPLTKHDHLVFELSSGYNLIYHDTRKFGTMHLYDLKDYKNQPPLVHVGPEPKDIEVSQFISHVQKRKTEIKAILLDQHAISGLGNIYVDETLFRARIHPTRLGSSLSDQEIKTIVFQAQDVLEEATLQGGTTIRTFEPMDGVHGRFQQELAVHTHVGKPCPICHTPIIKIKVKGRGTYVCPTCQH